MSAQESVKIGCTEEFPLWLLKILIILWSLTCDVRAASHLVSSYVDKHKLRVLSLWLYIVFKTSIKVKSGSLIPQFLGGQGQID